jgi:hypothetical protein
VVLGEFDNKLWAVAFENVKVMLDGGLVFHFKDMSDIKG